MWRWSRPIAAKRMKVLSATTVFASIYPYPPRFRHRGRGSYLRRLRKGGDAMHVARRLAHALMAPDGPGTGGTGTGTGGTDPDPPADIDEAKRRIAQALQDASTELDLGGLNLRELPEEIFQLAALERLRLASNKLATLDAK